jgi:hypothetical protein
MATKKGLVKFGGYVTRVVGPDAAWKTQIEEVSVMLPPSAEYTPTVESAVLKKALKRWKRCWVTETWRY